MDLEGSLERDDGVRSDSEGDSGGGGASGASAASAVSTAVPMRPACRHYDPAEPVVFMLLDSTHDDATITMYGVTARGESVIVVVDGFRPYFYVRAPADSDESEFAAELARKIGKGAAAVERVERVQSRSIMHYTTATRDYYRITVAKPQLVGPAVKALDADQGDWEHTLEASESKPAKYEERFFIDAGITGGGWVSCEGGRWTDAGAGDAQLCLDVSWDVAAPPLKSAGSGAEYQRLCPLRVLSMDILSDGALRQLHQPQAQATNLLGLSIVLDPGVDGVDIYKTALIVLPEKYKKGSGSLGVHAGMSLEYVRSETEMLTRFEELVVQLDPDFISGTDVGHSMQLLQFKAELLKLDSWGAGFGRGGALKVKKKQTYNPKWVKAAGRQSATSNQEGKEISSSGRIFIDVREAAQAQRNLRTYAFTEITEALLSGERAAWFSGATISQKLLRGFREQSDADICEVVRYSQKLADQARRCVAAMQVITEATTLARVTGQPLKSVWTRGKMLQAVNMLLRAARTRGFLVPDMGTPRDATATEAPLTYQPDARLHENPICVLDFASLYPSVIIGYNMSYDTLLTAAAQKSATAPQHEVVHLTSGGSDRNFGYVTADTHKGVVPEILENLLAERKEVKALLRDETDDSMRVILDLRQKSIKVAANAFYGFLGAQSSRLRCLPIAECTLGLGRAMLEHAKHLIEADDGRDTPDLPRTRPRVIYGDTDSVFVSYTGASLSVGQAARKARAQAEMVTRRIGRRPIELEYEKTYRRFVIQQIKRYAGAVVTEGFHGGDENEMDCDIKGFESQMRDTPAYIARAVRSVLVALTVGGGPAAARAAAVAAIHEVLGRRHHLLDLSHTRALKMWESASHASPAKTKKKRAAGEAEKDKTKLYDVTTAHVALATKIEQQYGGRVSFESGQRVSYVFCAPPAAAAQRASTGQKKLPLFQLATDPFEALAQGRSVDWDEALRQLCMPLQRIFCLRGVLGGDNGRGGGGGGGGSAPRDWESLLKIAEQEFDATARAAPWKQTHTSGGGGGGGGGGESSGGGDGKKAAKGTLGAFFKVKASSSCVICNRPGGTDGVCGRGECAQRVGTVRAELQQQVADAQMTQRVCLAEWRQCLGCEPTQWRIRAGGSSNAAAAAAAEGAGRRGKLLLGCENEYVDVPFRMELAVQAESRANQRLQRLGGGGGGAGL